LKEGILLNWAQPLGAENSYTNGLRRIENWATAGVVIRSLADGHLNKKQLFKAGFFFG
jgi:hypothetical protein